MRLDKFLKVTRIIKRRTVAKEIADQGRVLLNGKVSKSSSDVGANDNLVIKFGNRTLTIKVLQILDTTKKNTVNSMYEIINDEKSN